MDSLSDPFSVQKKIRNLSGIAFRHVDIGGDVGEEFGLASTLSCPRMGRDPFYISSVMWNNTNPTWDDLCDCETVTEISEVTAVVQLFYLRSRTSKPTRLLYLEIDLRVLVRIGDNMEVFKSDFQKNTVIFLFKSGLYVCPNQVPGDLNHSLLPLSRTVRKPYSVSTLRQIIKLAKDLTQARERKRRIQTEVCDMQRTQEKKSTISSEIEVLLSRTKNLSYFHAGLRKSNVNLDHLIEDLSTHNSVLTQSSVMNNVALLERLTYLEKLRLDVYSSREKLGMAKDKLTTRRCELISDLKYIYPIHRSTSGRTFIGGLWLPPLEQNIVCDDTTLGASLGAAAHLLVLLSRILGIPLRYRIRCNCSTSSIVDHITAKLLDREREYPLCPKTRDRSRFTFGVYLLNLCIAQLRLNCRMGTTDVKRTLENIQDFMDQYIKSSLHRSSSTSPTLSSITAPIPFPVEMGSSSPSIVLSLPSSLPSGSTSVETSGTISLSPSVSNGLSEMNGSPATIREELMYEAEPSRSSSPERKVEKSVETNGVLLENGT